MSPLIPDPGNRSDHRERGALTEQFVFQQLKGDPEIALYYWSASRSAAEIDFVAQYFGKVSAIEVKAEENLQAKSLKSFHQKYPQTNAVRTSMSDYREEDWMINLPLYAIKVLGQL